MCLYFSIFEDNPSSAEIAAAFSAIETRTDGKITRDQLKQVCFKLKDIYSFDKYFLMNKYCPSLNIFNLSAVELFISVRFILSLSDVFSDLLGSILKIQSKCKQNTKDIPARGPQWT